MQQEQESYLFIGSSPTLFIREQFEKGAQSMQKIKLEVLNRMIAAQLSKYEVLFLIVIARYQDQKGNILGVYYKDICQELGRISGKKSISYQKFYDCLYSLEEKAIIQVEKGLKDRNIRIIGNDFSAPDAINEGYISVGHTYFLTEIFGKLKANEMLLCMELTKNCEAGKRGDFVIGVDKFYEKYTKMLAVSKRVIQGYLTQIKKFFSIGVKEKKYWVEIKKMTLCKLPKLTSNKMYREHVGKTVMRRLRMKYTVKTFNETVDLIWQYFRIAKGQIIPLFVRAVTQSVSQVNIGVENKYKWDRQLRPALVHKLLKEAIATINVIG